ncbi:MAG: sulfur carrier protein ThiS [Zoogloeaceae bacterium]|nr:sulfur carrier protein ThiS [Zoogloeaceae bacterium]
MPAAGLSIAALLLELGYAGKRLAVERNGVIVPRSQHAETRIAAGDILEIVIAVGGG